MEENFWDKTIIIRNSTLSREFPLITNIPFRTLAGKLRINNYDIKILNPGERVGKYEIIEFLGNGSSSSVYLAKHIYLENFVALKTIINNTRVNAKMFLQEAQVLSLLAHKNVIKVFDADIFDGTPIIVMEYLIGESLVDILNRFNKLTIERSLDLLEELGNVLIKQEEKSILHLDIKPNNIFQRQDASFCLFDYGLVGLSENKLNSVNNKEDKNNSTYDNAIGTLAYMPPEQFSGNADNRSDIYSLGLTAWECLTGQQARNFSNQNDLFSIINCQITSPKILRDDVPQELNEVISNMITSSPEDRYQTAKDFMDDLVSIRYSAKHPIGSTLGTAFMAFPFLSEFDNVYNSISNSIRKVRLKARRLDKYVFLQDIWTQCLQEIEVSKVVIADFSGIISKNYPNPNVVTEAAHARAINKPVIIITQGQAEDLPFDWRYMPVINYANTEEGLKLLEELLNAKIKYILRK